MIAIRSAVAKVIVVPSDNDKVAFCGRSGCLTLLTVAPVIVALSCSAGEVFDAFKDIGRENNSARSITGGPGHDVIVEP